MFSFETIFSKRSLQVVRVSFASQRSFCATWNLCLYFKHLFSLFRSDVRKLSLENSSNFLYCRLLVIWSRGVEFDEDFDCFDLDWGVTVFGLFGFLRFSPRFSKGDPRAILRRFLWSCADGFLFRFLGTKQNETVLRHTCTVKHWRYFTESFFPLSAKNSFQLHLFFLTNATGMCFSL